MRPSILPDDASYTFADYFRLHIDIEDLLMHFGYRYQVANYCLPRSTRPLGRLDDLRLRLEESLPYISFNKHSPAGSFSLLLSSLRWCITPMARSARNFLLQSMLN